MLYGTLEIAFRERCDFCTFQTGIPAPAKTYIGPLKLHIIPHIMWSQASVQTKTGETDPKISFPGLVEAHGFEPRTLSV